MKTFKKPDSILFLTITLLLGLGILILGSVSPVFSMERFKNPNYLLNHQLLFGFLPGLFLGVIAFFVPIEKIKKFAFWFFLINIFLLGLLFISKTGLKFLGAIRWLDLGLFAFQPSEFLKLTFILYLSAWFAKKDQDAKNKIKRNWRERVGFLLPFLAIIGVIAVFLTLQPDIGTLGIVAITGLAMFFLAGTPLWQTILAVFTGVAALGLLIKMAPYRLSRLLIFLNPGADPTGQGYQISQALIAIGSGGIFGVGLGLSRQKFGFLPQTIGDAIFPVFAEETGFVGAVILISLFLIFLWRGLQIAFRTKDRFSQIVAIGISAWIGSQALINICSMTGLAPLTGVPLPFVSYGGSHLVTEMIGLGILLNISKQA
jgi:cell division protein FtsW